MRRIAIAGISMVAVVLIIIGGFALSRGIPSGIEQFPEGSPERDVSETAHIIGEGIARERILPRSLFWLIPAVRVSEVSPSPGNCTEYPAGSVPHEDYTATVTVYTIFRIPIRTSTLLCGARYF